jgi:23S rRNA (uracil1939-C5)-methyltransferase
MSQTNPKEEVTLEIDSLSHGPYGIARQNGLVVMIPGTAPGDKITARVVATKDRYIIGELVRLLEPSSDRQLPPCPYVAQCGGCSWQQVRYEAQLEAKQKTVEETLKRIGKLREFELRRIIPSPTEFGYRRRIRLQVDETKRLGFYHAASHRLAEIETCLIANKQAAACIETLRGWVSRLHTPIRNIEIVTGDQNDEVVISAESAAYFVSRDASACAGLLGAEPYIRGLIVCDSRGRQTWGDTKISVVTEDGIRLMVEADVFTQINPGGNRVIVNELLKAGEFSSADRALELYCGAGNFTLSIAKRVQGVVAVEGDRSAIQSGKMSGQLNGLHNIRWIHAQVIPTAKKLAEKRENFTKVILDPPRAGAKGIERYLASFGAAKILYISCNPATLARDASALSTEGYELISVQPIDLFPHTFHVEAIATFIHNKTSPSWISVPSSASTRNQKLATRNLS